MKVCNICEKQKPESGFSKRKASLDGLQHRCIQCARATFFVWVRKNRRKKLALRRVRYADNSERECKRAREWRRQNPEKVREMRRDLRRRHGPRINKATKKWRKENPGKIKEWRLTLYGLTLEKFNALKVKQKNACRICKEKFSQKRYACVDHSHTSGAVRGLLCLKCNTGLGMFRDSCKFLGSAIAYLKGTL